MSITLDSLTLPDELIWSDEFAWDSVEANAQRTIDGKLIVEETAIPGEQGRPITLTSEQAWMKRSDVNTLESWKAVAGKQMTLTLHDTRVFTVRFRHWDKPALQANPIIETAFPGDDTLYNLQLKLVVI